MNARWPLVAVSAGQLAAGLTGLVVALRRRRNYDVWLPVRGLRGSPEHVVRDSVLMGTAYSAPVPMLLAQGWSLGRLSARPDPRAARDLAVLGSLMVPGYLVERWGRTSLRRWDPVETPLVATSLGLAAAMAVLGARGSAGRIPGMRRS
jgi:hypothetical protein